MILVLKHPTRAPYCDAPASRGTITPNLDRLIAEARAEGLGLRYAQGHAAMDMGLILDDLVRLRRLSE